MTKSIVIIGGGFAGLEAAFSLKGLLGTSCEITLVDRSAYHSFIPSIHEIISGKVRPRDIQIPLATVLAPAKIRFVQDEVVSIDVSRRRITGRRRKPMYDYLIISSGAENNFFGVPGAEEYSCRFRTPEDAERIAVELNRIISDQTCSHAVVIAGAGTEGVEVAGELIDFIRETCGAHELESGRIVVELIERRDHPLPGFSSKVQAFTEDYLIRKGIRLVPGDRIAEVRKNEIVFESGRRREMSLLIWTGGIQPAKLIRDLPLAKDTAGWLKVTDRLQVFEDERVYGIGDAISIYSDEGPLSVQRLAYHAMDQARVAALNIAADLGGRDKIAYKPKTRPQLISIGKEMGILAFGERFRTGSWVVSLKKAVERKHLMTYLTKPVSSALWSRIPGAGFIQRLRTRLPV